MLVFADVEANGFNPDKIHCVAVLFGEYTEPILFTDMKDFESFVKANTITGWVFHNGLGYDVDVLNKLTSVSICKSKVIDTMVVSKTLAYGKFRTHSLQELGKFLGVHKGEYTGGFEEYSEEMGRYCKQDVVVLKAIYDYFKKDLQDPDNKEALRLEHDMAVVCKDMQVTGFPFNKEEALHLLDDVTKEMSVLETGFRSLLDWRRVEVKRVKLRYKKDGDLHASCVKAMTSNPDYEIDGDEIIVYGKSEFNPGSPKQRVDALWEYGWKPIDKTEGHKKWLKNKRTRR